MTNHQETHSNLCTLDRIDLFKNALYQNDITGSTWVRINRVDAGAGSTNLQFKIEGTSHYLDLQSTVLELDLKITTKKWRSVGCRYGGSSCKFARVFNFFAENT